MKTNTVASAERSELEQAQSGEPAQGQTVLQRAVAEVGRLLAQAVAGLGRVWAQAPAKLEGDTRAASPSLEKATEVLATAKPATDFSPEAIHKMLEINHSVTPDMPNMEFNSFMPSVALTATGFRGEERERFLAGVLALFGASAESTRGIGLKNAVNAFPANKPNGEKWSWADFSDPMDDPLDDKQVYQG